MFYIKKQKIPVTLIKLIVIAFLPFILVDGGWVVSFFSFNLAMIFDSITFWLLCTFYWAFALAFSWAWWDTVINDKK